MKHLCGNPRTIFILKDIFTDCNFTNIDLIFRSIDYGLAFNLTVDCNFTLTYLEFKLKKVFTNAFIS